MRGGTTASVTLLDLAAEAAHAHGAQHSSGCPSLRPQGGVTGSGSLPVTETGQVHFLPISLCGSGSRASALGLKLPASCITGTPVRMS